jgi:hypothetical protein
MVQEAPYEEMTRIIDFTFIGSRCMELLLLILERHRRFLAWERELTVPRQESLQESVFNSSMQHRELLKWHC